MLLNAFVLVECSKTGKPQKENFALVGYCTDCVSGKPLAGIPIIAQGQTQSGTGLFGNPSITYDLGETTTDINGYFKIIPLKVSGVAYFEILPNNSQKDISFFPSVTSDSIKQTLSTSYDLSFSINSYAYLKISFTDTSSPDTSDAFYLDVMCPGNACGPGYNSIQYESNPLPWPQELDVFKGAIKNGYAIFSVLGNNVNGISYTKTTKSGFGPNLGGQVFCKANDTTYYTIKY